MVWLPFVAELGDLVRLISPSAPGLSGTERLAAEVPRQVANAHTAFNVANAAVMIAFTGPIAALIRWILPDLPTPAERAKPRYLDDGFLGTPALAVDLLRMEIGHLGELVRKLLSDARGLRSADLLRPALVEAAEDVDALYEAIARYASRLLEGHAGEAETAELQEVLRVANHLHNIGDTISVNARTIANRLEASGLAASEQTRSAILGIVDELEGIVALAVWAYVTQDHELSMRVIGMKSGFYQGVRELERTLAGRLVHGNAGQLVKYRLEIEMLEVLKRIYYFAKRIAKTVAKDAAEPEVEDEAAA
jgi:phosphate:Na+ symporter